MPDVSAGLLLFRRKSGLPEVFLVHPGGPYWAGKDAGVWSIPKGLTDGNEDLLETAKREFAEETGFSVGGPFTPLGTVKLRSGKTVHAWAVEGDCDPAKLRSNTFELEWPPRSGRNREFPEVDRGEWFTLAEARIRINQGQAPFLDLLQKSFESGT